MRPPPNSTDTFVITAFYILQPDAAVQPDGPRSMGAFQVTFYYVATEEEVDERPRRARFPWTKDRTQPRRDAATR